MREEYIISMNTIDANSLLHTKLADVYKETEPHYRAENVERVNAIIKGIQQEVKANDLLDIGCGQGFIIDIAKKYFKEIRVIDVTPAMLDKIDLTSEDNCDISVSIANVESIPFDNESFDVCTAYAVLHHINDI